MDIVKKSRNFALSEIEKFGVPHLIHFEIAEKKAIQLVGRGPAHLRFRRFKFTTYFKQICLKACRYSSAVFFQENF